MGCRSVRCRLRLCNHRGDCDDDKDVNTVIMIKEQYLKVMIVCVEVHFNICKEIGV